MPVFLVVLRPHSRRLEFPVDAAVSSAGTFVETAGVDGKAVTVLRKGIRGNLLQVGGKGRDRKGDLGIDYTAAVLEIIQQGIGGHLVTAFFIKVPDAGKRSIVQVQ